MEKTGSFMAASLLLTSLAGFPVGGVNPVEWGAFKDWRQYEKQVNVLNAPALHQRDELSSASGRAPALVVSGCGNTNRCVYESLFDASKIRTVAGTVIRKDKVTSAASPRQGVTLTLRGSAGQTKVFLGPVWYVQNQDWEAGLEDVVEVAGSQVKFGAERLMIATRLRKGERTLHLRRTDGTPYWTFRAR